MEFFAKRRGHAGLIGTDPGSTRSDLLDLNLTAGGGGWLLMRVKATKIVESRFDGCGCTHVLGRRQAAEDGGERRRSY
jgi:hypothetical protein